MLVDGVVVFANGVELHGICKEFDEVRALNSLMVARCAGAQRLGDHTMGGVDTGHESIYYIVFPGQVGRCLLFLAAVAFFSLWGYLWRLLPENA